MIELDREKEIDAINSDLKMRWYKNEFSWIVKHHNCPEKDLIEVDPPECVCLLTIATELLRRGGDKVVLYRKEKHVENLSYVLTGTLMTDKKIKIRKGDPNRCHHNVSHLWMLHPKKYRMVSGFAMDGTSNMWIAHSWLLDKNSCIIETTFRFALYFGAVMDGKMAAEFAKRHINN